MDAGPRCRHIVGAMICFHIPFLLVIASLLASAQSLPESSAQQHANPRQDPTGRSGCDRAKEAVERSLAIGERDRAKQVAGELADQATGKETPCVAGLLARVSAEMGAAGRLSEAQALALKALAYLDSYSPESPTRTVPLYVLASVQLEQGMTGRARETYRRMERIFGATPVERSLIHAIGAELSQIESRWEEAESLYRQAAVELASAGREHGAEFADLLAGLASVQANEGQYPQALAAVDQGLKILETATDALPLDRIKLLNLRGVILARQNRWREAEADFEDAFSLARAQSQIDSLELDGLVENYVASLRKAHRRQEANAVLAWAATLRRSISGSNQVVDVTELLQSRHRVLKDK